MRGPIVFDHVAIALPRIAEAPAVLVGMLGGRPDAGGPSDVFSWGCWRFAGGGRIEVIEPRGPDGFLHRFLAGRGPGIHHVTFRVPSLDATCERAAARGYQVVGYDDRDPHWKVGYLHPKEAQGIVVQIAEASGRDARRPWAPPPGPPDPPPAVAVLGLRLRVHAAERAGAQWHEILGGEVADGEAGGLRFGWPGSPMRIAVDVDPVGPEGPLAIEVASARTLVPPAADPHGLARLFVRRGS